MDPKLYDPNVMIQSLKLAEILITLSFAAYTSISLVRLTVRFAPEITISLVAKVLLMVALGELIYLPIWIALTIACFLIWAVSSP